MNSARPKDYQVFVQALNNLKSILQFFTMKQFIS